MLQSKFCSPLSKILLLLCGLEFCTPNFAAPAITAINNADHLVSGIMSYTTWEYDLNKINVCIIDGPANFISSHIFNPPSPLIQPNTIKLFKLNADEILEKPFSLQETNCQVLYFVKTSDVVQQKIINRSLSSVLTISENNPECTIGSAFCLHRTNQHFKFQVNLHSLRQSKVKVNSKVLMLSQLGGN